MKKICIVNPYFGKFPASFPAFLRSCETNQSFDWIIFSDQRFEGSLPGNVQILTMTSAELRDRIEKMLGITLIINSPIKFCDFRPAFGMVFQEYIKDYPFWGHCDFDLVFGNLEKFVSPAINDGFDKIFVCGHLSLYRNSEEINSLYAKDAPGFSHREIFERPQHSWFEEYGGFKQIMDFHGVRYFEGLKMIADINQANFHFSLPLIPNHRHQAFYWENGSVYRAYYSAGRILCDEFVYVHFQKRQMQFPKFPIVSSKAFWIGPMGFFEKHSDELTVAILDRYNPRRISQDLLWRIKNFKETRIGRMARGVLKLKKS